MVMRWIESQLRESWDPRDSERADLVATMLKARGRDIPFPSEEAAIQAKFGAERLIKQQYRNAIDEYNSKQHTPEFLTTIWQAVYRQWFKELGIQMGEVPLCDRTQEEIQELEKKGRMVFYVPQELYQWGNGYFLERIGGDMEAGSYVGKFEDKYILHGWLDWLDIDATEEASYRGTSAEELRRAIESEGRIGAIVNPYIVCSLFSERVRGFNLDQSGTRSRLLGTVVDSKPVVFYYGGNYRIPFGIEFTSDPNERDPKLGGRSIGMKSSANSTLL